MAPKKKRVKLAKSEVELAQEEKNKHTGRKYYGGMKMVGPPEPNPGPSDPVPPAHGPNKPGGQA